jgi:hypothetical protein
MAPCRVADARNSRKGQFWGLEIDSSSGMVHAVGLASGPTVEGEAEEQSATVSVEDGPMAALNASREPLFFTKSLSRIIVNSRDRRKLMLELDQSAALPVSIPSQSGGTLALALHFANEAEAHYAQAALLVANPQCVLGDDCESDLSASRVSYDCGIVVFRDGFEAHRRILEEALPPTGARATVGIECAGLAVVDTRFGALEIWAAAQVDVGGQVQVVPDDLSEASDADSPLARRAAKDPSSVTSPPPVSPTLRIQRPRRRRSSLPSVLLKTLEQSQSVPISPDTPFVESPPMNRPKRRRRSSLPSLVVDSPSLIIPATKADLPPAMPPHVLVGPPGEHSFVDVRSTGTPVDDIPNPPPQPAERRPSATDARDTITEEAWVSGDRPRPLRLLTVFALNLDSCIVETTWDGVPCVHTVVGLLDSVPRAVSLLVPSKQHASRLASRLRTIARDSGDHRSLGVPSRVVPRPRPEDVVNGVNLVFDAFKPSLQAALIMQSLTPGQMLDEGGMEKLYDHTNRRLRLLLDAAVERIVTPVQAAHASTYTATDGPSWDPDLAAGGGEAASEVSTRASRLHRHGWTNHRHRGSAGSVVSLGSLRHLGDRSYPHVSRPLSEAPTPDATVKPLRVSCATWSVSERPPPSPSALVDWIPPNSADMVVVALTEVHPSHRWRWVRALERLLASCPSPATISLAGDTTENIAAAAAAAMTATMASTAASEAPVGSARSSGNDRSRRPHGLIAASDGKGATTHAQNPPATSSKAWWIRREEELLKDGESEDSPSTEGRSWDEEAVLEQGYRHSLPPIALPLPPKRALTPIEAELIATISAARAALGTLGWKHRSATAEALARSPPETRTIQRLFRRQTRRTMRKKQELAVRWTAQRIRTTIESLVSSALEGPKALAFWLASGDDATPAMERDMSHRASLAAEVVEDVLFGKASTTHRTSHGSSKRRITADHAVSIMGNASPETGQESPAVDHPMSASRRRLVQAAENMRSVGRARVASVFHEEESPSRPRAMPLPAAREGSASSNPFASKLPTHTDPPSVWRYPTAEEVAGAGMRTLKTEWHNGILLMCVVRAERVADVTNVRATFVEPLNDVGVTSSGAAEGSDDSSGDEGKGRSTVVAAVAKADREYGSAPADPTCIGGMRPIEPDTRTPCAVALAVELQSTSSLAFVAVQLTAQACQSSLREKQAAALLEATAIHLPRHNLTAHERKAADMSNRWNGLAAKASSHSNAHRYPSSAVSLWQHHDSVFLLGDLNYPIEGAQSIDARREAALAGLAQYQTKFVSGEGLSPMVQRRIMQACSVTIPRVVFPVRLDWLPSPLRVRPTLAVASAAAHGAGWTLLGFGAPHRGIEAAVLIGMAVTFPKTEIVGSSLRAVREGAGWLRDRVDDAAAIAKAALTAPAAKPEAPKAQEEAKPVPPKRLKSHRSMRKKSSRQMIAGLDPSASTSLPPHLRKVRSELSLHAATAPASLHTEEPSKPSLGAIEEVVEEDETMTPQSPGEGHQSQKERSAAAVERWRRMRGRVKAIGALAIARKRGQSPLATSPTPAIEDLLDKFLDSGEGTVAPAPNMSGKKPRTGSVESAPADASSVPSRSKRLSMRAIEGSRPGLTLESSIDGDGAGTGKTKLYHIEVELPEVVTPFLLPGESRKWVIRRSFTELEALHRRLAAFSALFDPRLPPLVASLELEGSDEEDDDPEDILRYGLRTAASAAASVVPGVPDFPAVKSSAASRLKRAFLKRRPALHNWLSAVIARPAAWASPHLPRFLDHKGHGGPLWRLLHLPWARLAAQQRVAAALPVVEGSPSKASRRVAVLAARDGLSLTQRRGGTLSDWSEGPLLFPPTSPLRCDASLSDSTGAPPAAQAIAMLLDWISGSAGKQVFFAEAVGSVAQEDPPQARETLDPRRDGGWKLHLAVSHLAMFRPGFEHPLPSTGRPVSWAADSDGVVPAPVAHPQPAVHYNRSSREGHELLVEYAREDSSISTDAIAAKKQSVTSRREETFNRRLRSGVGQSFRRLQAEGLLHDSSSDAGEEGDGEEATQRASLDELTDLAPLSVGMGMGEKLTRPGALAASEGLSAEPWPLLASLTSEPASTEPFTSVPKQRSFGQVLSDTLGIRRGGEEHHLTGGRDASELNSRLKHILESMHSLSVDGLAPHAASSAVLAARSRYSTGDSRYVTAGGPLEALPSWRNRLLWRTRSAGGWPNRVKLHAYGPSWGAVGALSSAADATLRLDRKTSTSLRPLSAPMTAVFDVLPAPAPVCLAEDRHPSVVTAVRQSARDAVTMAAVVKSVAARLLPRETAATRQGLVDAATAYSRKWKDVSRPGGRPSVSDARGLLTQARDLSVPSGLGVAAVVKDQGSVPVCPDASLRFNLHNLTRVVLEGVTVELPPLQVVEGHVEIARESEDAHKETPYYRPSLHQDHNGAALPSVPLAPPAAVSLRAWGVWSDDAVISEPVPRVITAAKTSASLAETGFEQASERATHATDEARRHEGGDDRASVISGVSSNELLGGHAEGFYQTAGHPLVSPASRFALAQTSGLRHGVGLSASEARRAIPSSRAAALYAAADPHHLLHNSVTSPPKTLAPSGSMAEFPVGKPLCMMSRVGDARFVENQGLTLEILSSQWPPTGSAVEAIHASGLTSSARDTSRSRQDFVVGSCTITLRACLEFAAVDSIDVTGSQLPAAFAQLARQVQASTDVGDLGERLEAGSAAAVHDALDLLRQQVQTGEWTVHDDVDGSIESVDDQSGDGELGLDESSDDDGSAELDRGIVGVVEADDAGDHAAQFDVKDISRVVTHGVETPSEGTEVLQGDDGGLGVGGKMAGAVAAMVFASGISTGGLRGERAGRPFRVPLFRGSHVIGWVRGRVKIETIESAAGLAVRSQLLWSMLRRRAILSGPHLLRTLQALKLADESMQSQTAAPARRMELMKALKEFPEIRGDLSQLQCRALQSRFETLLRTQHVVLTPVSVRAVMGSVDIQVRSASRRVLAHKTVTTYNVTITLGNIQWCAPHQFVDVIKLDAAVRDAVSSLPGQPLRGLPPTPPVMRVGSSSVPGVVKRRMGLIETYLRALVQCPAAWRCPAMFRFLDSPARHLESAACGIRLMVVTAGHPLSLEAAPANEERARAVSDAPSASSHPSGRTPPPPPPRTRPKETAVLPSTTSASAVVPSKPMRVDSAAAILALLASQDDQRESPVDDRESVGSEVEAAAPRVAVKSSHYDEMDADWLAEEEREVEDAEIVASRVVTDVAHLSSGPVRRLGVHFDSEDPSARGESPPHRPGLSGIRSFELLRRLDGNIGGDNAVQATVSAIRQRVEEEQFVESDARLIAEEAYRELVASRVRENVEALGAEIGPLDYTSDVDSVFSDSQSEAIVDDSPSPSNLSAEPEPQSPPVPTQEMLPRHVTDALDQFDKALSGSMEEETCPPEPVLPEPTLPEPADPLEAEESVSPVRDAEVEAMLSLAATALRADGDSRVSDSLLSALEQRASATERSSALAAIHQQTAQPPPQGAASERPLVVAQHLPSRPPPLSAALSPITAVSPPTRPVPRVLTHTPAVQEPVLREALLHPHLVRGVDLPFPEAGLGTESLISPQAVERVLDMRRRNREGKRGSVTVSVLSSTQIRTPRRAAPPVPPS